MCTSKIDIENRKRHRRKKLHALLLRVFVCVQMRVCRIICFRSVERRHWISPTTIGKVHSSHAFDSSTSFTHKPIHREIDTYHTSSTLVTEVELCFDIMSKRRSGRLQHTTVVEFPSELRSFHNITNNVNNEKWNQTMVNISEYQCQCSFNAHTHLPSHTNTSTVTHSTVPATVWFWTKLESNQLSPLNSSVWRLAFPFDYVHVCELNMEENCMIYIVINKVVCTSSNQLIRSYLIPKCFLLLSGMHKSR